MPVNRSKVKATTGLALQKQLMKIKFTDLKEFTEEVGHFLASSYHDLGKKVDQAIQQNPDEKDEIIDSVIDDIHKYQRTYVAILYNSLLVAVYSEFEKSFHQICIHTQRESNIPSKKKLNYLDSYRSYLLNDVGVDIDTGLARTWKKLNDKYRELRNAIVHREADYLKDKKMDKKQHPLYHYIRKNPYIKLKGENSTIFYISDPKYITEFCDVSYVYLSSVIDKIHQQTRVLAQKNP